MQRKRSVPYFRSWKLGKSGEHIWTRHLKRLRHHVDLQSSDRWKGWKYMIMEFHTFVLNLRHLLVFQFDLSGAPLKRGEAFWHNDDDDDIYIYTYHMYIYVYIYIWCIHSKLFNVWHTTQQRHVHKWSLRYTVYEVHREVLTNSDHKRDKDWWLTGSQIFRAE